MKEVTMTNSEVKGLIMCLKQLASVNTELGARTWYGISRSHHSLDKADISCEEVRVKLAKKYTKEGEDRVAEDNINKFQDEYQKVLNDEVKVSVYQIKLSSLESESEKMKGVNNIDLFFTYCVIEE